VSLNEAVPADTVVLAEQFLALQETNFVAQTEFLGLDPRSDFRQADLFCVDFSNSDIRGYDFTGSDLRGATGINVKWDQTTILKDAETASSVFAYAQARDAYFRNHPDLAEQVQRLSKEHWTHTILEVADLLDRKKVNPDSLWVAKSLFDATKSLPVRSNILYFMSPASDDPEQHKDFIYNICARYSDEPPVIKSAIRTLNALYLSDIGVVNVLGSFLDHSDIAIRNEALKGILSSRYFSRASPKLLQYTIACGDSLLRRRFVGRAARAMGPEYVRAATDTATKNFLDFAEPITTGNIMKIAETTLRQEKFLRMSASTTSHPLKLEASLKMEESVIEERAAEYRDALEQMKKRFRIPFVFKN